MANIPSVDELNRTTLLLMHRHNLNFQDAETFKNSTTLQITASDSVCSVRNGQAALTTAVAVGVRAFGTVKVFLADPDRIVLGGSSRGMTLGEFVAAEGAVLGPASSPAEGLRAAFVGRAASIALGRPAHPGAVKADLIATWTSWTATISVTSAHPAADGPADMPIGDGNVLSAIAAAALAVSEAFLKIFIAEPGSDAGFRNLRLNLYAASPKVGDGPEVSAPELSYAPGSWWLLGLGHLGQAYAHVISWLEYADPGAVEVVLQDTDKANPANHSTGVLTGLGVNGTRKTRMVAEKLENAGLTTRVIEQRFDELSVRQPYDMHTALIGVDNLNTRRRISGFGWNTAIDVGLGADLPGFDGITLRRFPGSTPSDQVPAWQEHPTAESDIDALPDNSAIREMHEQDPCGALVVAGTAVGVSFVGVVAACLAVAEVIRDLHGGAARAVATYTLGEADLRTVLATVAEPAIPVELRTDP